VYVGTDPLTRRPIRLKSTVKTEQQAQIELGRPLEEASEGRTPESGATVAKLMDEYAAVAEWDVSTRQTSEGFIRRTIKPRPRADEGPQGPRPHPGQAVRGAQALRRPVLHRQAVHRAPQRPGANGHPPATAARPGSRSPRR
jgi:hypothetical protein